MFVAGFKSLDIGTEERTSLHCTNIFEQLRGGSDTSWIDHHGLWVMGFWIWSVHKVSVNAVEEERQTMTQKSSYGSVPPEINVNFIFRHPKRGDGEMGAVSGKCRLCFLCRNTPQIENLYLKGEAELWVGNLFLLHHDNTTSRQADSTPYSPDLAPCSFFIFPKLKLVLKWQHLGDLERIKSKQPPTAEHSQIWLRKVLWWLVTVSTDVYSYSGGLFWGGWN